MSELEIADHRVLFMAAYVLKITKQKPDKFMKPWGLEDTQNVFQNFFEDKAIRIVFIYLGTLGVFVAQTNWPGIHKAKGCYFIKKKQGVIKKDEQIHNVCFYGDMSTTPIDQLSLLLDEVLVPMLGSSQTEWPKVVAQDVKRNVESLKCKTFMISGLIKGMTMLPLPTGADSSTYVDELEKEGPNEYKMIHAIETVVIEWVHQLRDVLMRDPAQALLDGKNPTPFVEIKFWENKCINLECIYTQLCHPKVQKMAAILEAKNSSFSPTFKNVFRDTVAALAEARDISLFLSPLRYQLEAMEQVPFEDIEPYLRPLMNTVALVWANSDYFNTPTRIIVFMQEICNLIIEMARTMLEPNELLKGDVTEMLITVKKALTLLYAFRESYNEHVVKLPNYFTGGNEPIEWDFPPVLIFHRFDKFVNMLETVEDLMKTNIEFQKLEKIELGGIAGKTLSALVVEIYNYFLESYKVFSDGQFDCLDTGATEFMKLGENFRAVLNDLDRKLSTIILRGFEDCVTLESSFKLISMMGHFLERTLIKTDFESKYPVILKQLSDKLDQTQEMITSHMDHVKYYKTAPVHMNMPQISGNLKWAREIKQRISIPMDNYRALNHPSTQSPDAHLMYEKYEALLRLLNQWEVEQYIAWTDGVDEACSFNLDLPIIKRLPNNVISVNFDPALVSVLRETHFLNVLEMEDVPESAQKIFDQNETFRKFVANLDMMVRWYNKVRNTTISVEFPLIADQLTAIDEDLQNAETNLHWKDDGVWEYIAGIRDKVHDLEMRVQQAKDNDQQIQQIMTTWTKVPLFERKEEKNTSYLYTTDREDRCRKRYNEITAAGNKIHELVKANRELFKVFDDNAITWRMYLDYLDEYLVEGFFNTILCSLNYFLVNTDVELNPEPLFKAKMELQVSVSAGKNIFIFSTLHR